MTHRSSLSLVIPCLNEAQTLPAVLTRIQEVRTAALADRTTEVIVVDNGSTDGSDRIASEHGARVIPCSIRGYGAALREGIRVAQGEFVVYADADNTYDFRETPKLVTALDNDADLVLGSRLSGTIFPGAMPALHRYVGTPFLSFLINLLYGHGRHQRITDCNSGFRGVRRTAFLDWDVRSTGMEFASEMLVKALTQNARIVEVPISLAPDTRDRTPHLKTWRDGMRHLLQILLGSPAFFSTIGTTIFSISWTLTLLSLFAGPRMVGPVSILGLHTMMFALLGTIVGLTIWATGLFLAARHPKPAGLYDRVLRLREDILFWASIALGIVFFGALFWILGDWMQQGFRSLALERQTLALITVASNSLLLLSQVVAAHMIKRAG